MEPIAIKQVIVYRRDLQMRKGKIAAQVAHASMKVFLDRKSTFPGTSTPLLTPEGVYELPPQYLLVPLTPEMAIWVNGLFGKIVLSVENEEDLLRVYSEAKARGLPASLVTDAGRTEFKKECPTCEGGKLVSLDIKRNPMRVGCLVCGDTGKVGVPTHTTVAIGPAQSSEIDVITGPGGLVTTKLA